MYREVEIPGLGVLWRSERSEHPAAPTVIPADGSADIILRDDELVVAGPSTRWLLGSGSSQGPTIGLRFASGLAGSMLRLDADALRDRLVPGTDALAAETLRRGERALRAAAAVRSDSAMRAPSGAAAPVFGAGVFGAAVFDAITGSGFTPAGTALDWVAEARRAAGRGEPVTVLAARLGTSERQLHRRMRQHFGYGYAALRRVLRAERARALIVRGAPLAVAAQGAGYSDQAHLTREFRELVGATPGGFAASTSDAANAAQASDPEPSGA